MANKSFGNSIGGNKGSRALNTSSVGLNNASGGAIGGYSMPKSSRGPGSPDPHTSASEPSRPKPPTGPMPGRTKPSDGKNA